MAFRSTDTLVLAVSVLAVLGVALVAGTLGSMVFFDPGGDQPEVPDRPGVPDPVPDQDPGDDGDAPSETVWSASLVFCIEFLTDPGAVIGLTAGLVGLLYLLYLRFNFATALLTGTFLMPVVMMAYFFLTNCPSSGGKGGGTPVPEVGGGSPIGLEGLGAIPPSVIGVVLVGLVAVAATVLVSMSSREDVHEDGRTAATASDPDAAAFARAASRARQRIEEANVPVDNAVYQAWLEMTGLLAIEHPETAAPFEFADAAIEAGLEEADVYELTELFTEVRYGRKDATTREDRAVAVLRTIEETYDPGGADAVVPHRRE